MESRLLPSALEVKIFKAINQGPVSPFMDYACLFLTNSRTWWVVAFSFLVYGYAKGKRWILRAWILIALTVGVADFVSFYLLKPTFKRVRPCYTQGTTQARAIRGCGSWYGFPSNHAANGAAATTLLLVLPTPIFVKVSAVVLCLLVALTRIYLGVHLPLDILAGFLLGTCVALVCRSLWTLFETRFPLLPSAEPSK